MKLSTAIVTTLVLAGVLAVPHPARAQWSNPYTGRNFNNPISSSLDTMINNSMQRKMLERSIAAQRDRSGKPAAPARPVVHAALSASDFKPTSRRPAVDAFLRSTEMTDEQRGQLRQVIDATFVAVESQLRKNNVATALGFVIGASVEIANGKEVSDADAQELIAGINDLLAGSADFKKLANKERQAIYDTLIATGALLMTLHAAGETDPALKQSAIDMARAVLSQLTGSKTGR